jgi:hypothetical protein
MQVKSLSALMAVLLASAALTTVPASAAKPVTCSQLATLLSAQSNISQTASDNQGLVSPSAIMVPATATNNGRSNKIKIGHFLNGNLPDLFQPNTFSG